MIITHTIDDAIKSVTGKSAIGQGIRFGSPQTADNSKEWFSAKTNTGVRNGDTRPYLMEHGKSSDFGLTIVGYAVYELAADGWNYEVKMRDDAVGERALAELATGLYKSSSGSSWHTTSITKTILDTFHYDDWFLVEQSATKSAADRWNAHIRIKSLFNEDLTPTELFEKLWDEMDKIKSEISKIKNDEVEIFRKILKGGLVEEVSTKSGCKLPPDLEAKINSLAIEADKL